MDLHVRRLQTLRQRGLSGGVSYGRDCAHRVRFSICAARRLQRLRELRGLLSFGVIDKDQQDGRAFKCTFCYDRQLAGMIPACAKACPTQSIHFGELDELQEQARGRLAELHQRGYQDARIYDAQGTSVGGTHALFLILGEPEAYNLPPAPEVPTVHLRAAWISVLVSADVLFAVVCLAFAI
jgi:formate dehydrogenase iron-sulfur subunit